MCDNTCNIDDSQCVSDIPTTGMDSDAPTTNPSGTDSTGGTGGSGSGEGEGGAQDGCSCRSGNTPSPWLSLLGMSALSLCRRRRQFLASGLVACLIVTSGCHTVAPSDTDSDGTGSTAEPSSSSGGPDAVALRMFGAFHDEGRMVGYVNPGMDSLYFWGGMEISSEGTIVVRRRVCEGDPETQEFTWTHLGNSELQIVPDSFEQDGTFKFLADPVTAVTIKPGDGCDDISMRFEYLPESGKPPATLKWMSGEICAKSLGEVCHYELVWCAGTPPPECSDG